MPARQTRQEANMKSESFVVPKFLILSVTTSLLILSGCSGGKKEPPAVPVRAEKAIVKDMPKVITAIGSIEALASVTVKTLVSGELQRVHFTEGSVVKKGDILFTIDPRPYRASVKQAEADLLKAKAQAAAALANARRSEGLVEKGYIADQQLEDIQAKADSALADEKAAEASLDRARLDLENCSILAPMDCWTGNVKVKVGNIVKANETELTVLNQVSPVNAAFTIPDKHLEAVRSAMTEGKVPVTASVTDGRKVPGELSFIDNTVDPATGSILVKAVFSNEDGALWPGQFANLTVTLGTIAGAVVVPSEAVQTGQQGEYVFVVKEDMTVSMSFVKTGQALDGSVVVSAGVREGETVVTDGHLRLKPGSKVEIRK